MLSKNRMKWLRSLQLKKYRTQEGLFVAEGPKLIGELLAAGYECVYAITCMETSFQCPLIGGENVVVDNVTEEELRRVSSVETPQGVLAVFRQPDEHLGMDEYVDSVGQSLCLALDDVQNPGNLGTIIRLADWFGIRDVFCSRGCADLYNPKTVQATMGAIAHVRVHCNINVKELCDAITKTPHKSIPIYGTFLDGENIYQKSLSRNGLIVMGNEGRGIHDDIAATVTERLFVPSYGTEGSHVESLNVGVATAIVCAEFRRQMS